MIKTCHSGTLSPGMTNKNIIEYILKYIEKEENKIVYSRSIPTDIILKLNPEEAIAVVIESYINRYVLFDDVICDLDIEHYILGSIKMIC